MINKPNQSRQLSDSDYIYWAKKDEWSLTQAVCLLYGFLPPESDFPDPEELIEYQEQQKSKERTHCPEEWVILAISDGHIVNDCWKLIYPHWIPDDIGVTLGKKLNYPRYIEVLGTNTSIALEQLVSFALNLSDEKMTSPPKEFGYLLEDMKKRLSIKTNNPEELRKRMVSPRQFMDKCPKSKFAINRKCLHWYELLNSNPDIADWLEGSNKVKKVRSGKKNSKESLPEKGGIARAAKYKKLELHSIELYIQKKFHSVRDASIRLVDPVNQYAEENGLILLTKNNAQATIYGWLLKYDKQSK